MTLIAFRDSFVVLIDKLDNDQSPSLVSTLKLIGDITNIRYKTRMMSRLILSFFSFVSNALLLLFTLRRWLYLAVAWRLETDPSLPCPPSPLPHILLLVPFRDEAANLRQLLPLLARLNYPAERLTVVLIDDGSQDDSGRFCQQFIAQCPNRHLLTLPHNMGKAAALNEALRHFADGEFVAVYDADERPSPHTLIHLLTAFHDDKVGAANGRRAVANPLATPIASYAALENLVHQQITNRAKDKLNLAPALLGSNCLYRREALTAAHNFTPNTFLEDSDLTLRLVQAGWHTRFISAAISYHAVPATLRAYWQQHARWHTGFQQVAQGQATAVLTQVSLPLRLRLELLLFSFGYLDRLALFIALISSWQWLSRSVTLNISLHLLTPLLQIITALKAAKAPVLLWWRLAYLPLCYALDIAVTLASTIQRLLGRPIQWETRSI